MTEHSHSLREQLLGEGAFGAALKAVGEAARESNEGYWPPLVTDILTIGNHAAGY